MKNFPVWICLILITACSIKPDKTKKASTGNAYPLSYATKFEISDNELIVLEPWPGSTKPQSFPIPDSTPQKVVVTSTTHLPYLEMLGLEDKLVGFPSTQYISSQMIRQKVAAGEITDLGPDGNINVELVIALQPDVVFAFDMGSESFALSKIRESGIPVIYNADFLEQEALGRAEWIKFFGAYFHKSQLADSIFNTIASRYDSLKNLTTNVANRPAVLSGVMYGDVWFLPGGQNWAAKFYKDAGGHYLWQTDATSGWLELSFESVLSKGREADFWLGVSTFNSKEELANNNIRYTEFEAFKTDKIFNYSKRINPSGGYDFFESAYARPDRVLADMIAILHPELLPDYQMYYFQKLP